MRWASTLRAENANDRTTITCLTNNDGGDASFALLDFEPFGDLHESFVGGVAFPLSEMRLVVVLKDYDVPSVSREGRGTNTVRPEVPFDLSCGRSRNDVKPLLEEAPFRDVDIMYHHDGNAVSRR